MRKHELIRSGSLRRSSRALPKIVLAIVFCLLIKRVFSQHRPNEFDLKPFALGISPAAVHSSLSSSVTPSQQGSGSLSSSSTATEVARGSALSPAGTGPAAAGTSGDVPLPGNTEQNNNHNAPSNVNGRVSRVQALAEIPGLLSPRQLERLSKPRLPLAERLAARNGRRLEPTGRKQEFPTGSPVFAKIPPAEKTTTTTAAPTTTRTTAKPTTTRRSLPPGVGAIRPFSLDRLTQPPPPFPTPAPFPFSHNLFAQHHNLRQQFPFHPRLPSVFPTPGASEFMWTPFQMQLINSNGMMQLAPTPAAPGFGQQADLLQEPRLCPMATLGSCRCTEPEEFETIKLPNMECSRLFSAAELQFLRAARGIHFGRIVLKGTGISTLPEAAFGPHSAEEYWITDNPALEAIEENFLGFHADPKKLIIRNNKISRFPFQDLRRLRSLEYFVANGNELGEITDMAFNVPGGSMIDILLHDNQIKKLGARAFGNLHNLNAVTLHNNQIEEIRSESLYFSGEPQTLSLSGNHIDKVDRDAFGGSIPRLIDLSRNRLEVFDKEPWAFVLSTMTQMLALDPRRPAKLLLSGNPMACGCDILWLYETRDNFGPVMDGIFCQRAAIPQHLFNLPIQHFYPQCV